MSAEKKTFRGDLVLKADSDQGEFVAEFATLDVIDHDKDVTEAGAFEDGQECVIEAWNHGYGDLPVGRGVIHERDGKAVVEGRFLLETTGGKDHYLTVKELGNLIEWSYTFAIKDSGFGTFGDPEEEVRFLRGLDVWGVAPVQRGAGIDTGTTSIKSAADLDPEELKAEDLQELHDMLVSLGAKCTGHGGDGDETPASESSSQGEPDEDPELRSKAGTLAARVAIELMEAGIEV